MNLTPQERADGIRAALKEFYPESQCALVSQAPHELLIAVRLSAQCTDKRVNMVTPALFERFPSADAFADADTAEIEPYIHSCGLYKTKAKDIRDMCVMLRDRFGGVVPQTIDELLLLPGVGRKTANLVAGDIYHMPGAVVVDTHCIRLSNRMGLVASKDTRTIENELRRLLPPEESNDFCHRLVQFGRDICPAAKPGCDICPVRGLCLTGSAEQSGS